MLDDPTTKSIASGWLDWKTLAGLAGTVIGVLFWGWYSLFYSVITESVSDIKQANGRQWEAISNCQGVAAQNKWRHDQTDREIEDLRERVRDIERELGWRTNSHNPRGKP